MWDSQRFYILVLAIILISVLIEKFLPIHRVVTFRGMLFSELAIVILSEILIQAQIEQSINRDGLFLLTSVMYFMFLIRDYLHSFFVCTHIEIEEGKFNRIKKCFNAILLVSSILVIINFATNELFYVGTLGYERGHLFYLSYIFNITYASIALFCIGRNYKRMLMHDIVSMIFYVLILIADLINRYVTADVYHVKPLSVISILIAYLLFEEPMNYRDGYVKLFDKSALDLFIREKINRKKFNLIFMSIKQYYDRREILGDDVIKEIEIEISKFLQEEITGRYIFYLDSGIFAIADLKGRDPWKCINSIRYRFLKPFNTSEGDIFLEVNISETSEPYKFKSASELVAIMIDDLELKDKEDVDDSIVITHAKLERSRKRFNIKKILQNLENDNRLLVYLQPIMDAKTEKLVGAEALARLRDDDGSIIYPDSFIPCAEENGSITTLGLEVIKQTALFLNSYEDKVPLKWVNVNISPIQCQDPNLNIKIKDVISRYKLDKSKLHIEITEQAFSNQKLLGLFMQSMMEDGYEFVADDFGSGYNNIEMILNHPFKNVKFDKDTTWNGLIRYPEVIEGLINIFRNSGYAITAEGVETKEMVDALRGMGATYLQGYYFSKPIPISEFVEKYKKD